MTSPTPIAVVIPAHDEESVIGRCLRALLTDAEAGELDVVVVCNGCRDRTAGEARAHGAPVRVIETPVASKTAALNLGDTAVSGFPRFYVDADVVLPLASVRLIAGCLEPAAFPAASPAMDVDLGSSSWPVRAYYAVWTRLPYVREGLIGVGVYALSADGRRRFDQFPEVIADDGYVRMLFAAHERPRVANAPVRVTAPARLSDLIRVKTRSRLGGYQLTERFPDLAARERQSKSYGSAMAFVAVRPWLWPHAAVYAVVQLTTRRRARRQQARGGSYVWERDLSARRR